MIWKVIPMVARGGYDGAFMGIPLTAASGLVLAIIWRQDLAGMVAKPFGALYDGGDAEVDPQAYYSIAEAKRKRGHYTEAIAAIRTATGKISHRLHGPDVAGRDSSGESQRSARRGSHHPTPLPATRSCARATWPSRSTRSPTGTSSIPWIATPPGRICSRSWIAFRIPNSPWWPSNGSVTWPAPDYMLAPHDRPRGSPAGRGQERRPALSLPTI